MGVGQVPASSACRAGCVTNCIEIVCNLYLPPLNAASRARTSGSSLIRITVRRGCRGDGTECAVTRAGCAGDRVSAEIASTLVGEERSLSGKRTRTHETRPVHDRLDDARDKCSAAQVLHLLWHLDSSGNNHIVIANHVLVVVVRTPLERVGWSAEEVAVQSRVDVGEDGE